MNQPEKKWTLIDLSNHLIAEAPAVLSMGQVPVSDGTMRLAMTVRTSSTTLTVLLGKQDAAAWAAQFAKENQEFQAGSKLVAAKGPLLDPAAAFRPRR